jgi:hypothetical protein
MAAARVTPATREQHPALALEDPLNTGDRVRPVLLRAREAREMIGLDG